MKRAPEKVYVKLKINMIRLLFQILSTLIIFGGIFGLAATIIVIPVLVPIGNPYTIVAGAWEILEALLTMGVIPFIAIVSIALFALLAGRVGCAWWCPFGLIQDIISYVGKKKRISYVTNRKLTNIALFFLIIFLLIDLSIFYGKLSDINMKTYFGAFVRRPSSILDPSSTLFSMLFFYFYWELYPKRLSDLSKLVNYPPAFYFRIILLIIILIVTYYYPRAYCRWLCPMGYLMGFLGKYAILRVYRDPFRCTRCGECNKVCPMGINLLEYNGPIESELCIMCLACMEACSVPGALRVKLNIKG